ncbi:MAG TPA: ClpXP protease specificity-enhancing factor SspB [Stellaceae bacterium]|nr:ClpXP protease specificity-enhancing factor SspB [Stellaceae bacterium]
MAQDLFHYEKMVEGALRGVVRDALRQAARDGLRSAHHFYIGFGTRMPGVVIPDHLRERYPDEMTIVLQHQFWDLEITEIGFSVTLSFQKQLERLVIPFAAVRSFADPSVNFALEFAVPETASATSGTLPVPLAAPPAPTEKPPEKPPERPSGEVVALDSFRKR